MWWSIYLIFVIKVWGTAIWCFNTLLHHTLLWYIFFFGITKCVVEKGVGAPRNVSCMDPTKVCGEQGSWLLRHHVVVLDLRDHQLFSRNEEAKESHVTSLKLDKFNWIQCREFKGVIERHLIRKTIWTWKANYNEYYYRYLLNSIEKRSKKSLSTFSL